MTRSSAAKNLTAEHYRRARLIFQAPTMLPWVNATVRTDPHRLRGGLVPLRRQGQPARAGDVLALPPRAGTLDHPVDGRRPVRGRPAQHMSVRQQVVALEEHIVTPDVLAAWERLDPSLQDLSLAPSQSGDTGRGLLGPRATLTTPDPVAAAAELERAVSSLGLAGAMVFGRTRDRHLDHPSLQPDSRGGRKASRPALPTPAITTTISAPGLLRRTRRRHQRSARDPRHRLALRDRPRTAPPHPGRSIRPLPAPADRHRPLGRAADVLP